MLLWDAGGDKVSFCRSFSDPIVDICSMPQKRFPDNVCRIRSLKVKDSTPRLVWLHRVTKMRTCHQPNGWLRHNESRK